MDGSSSRGYEVITASGGIEAVRIGRERLSEIDALVTDVVLPLSGGREVASRNGHGRLGPS